MESALVVIAADGRDRVGETDRLERRSGVQKNEAERSESSAGSLTLAADAPASCSPLLARFQPAPTF